MTKDKLQNLIDTFGTLLLGYSLSVVGAIVTLIVGYLLAGWLARWTTRLVRKSPHIDPVFHLLPGRQMNAGAAAQHQIAPVVGRALVRTLEGGPDAALRHLQKPAGRGAERNGPRRRQGPATSQADAQGLKLTFQGIKGGHDALLVNR